MNTDNLKLLRKEINLLLSLDKNSKKFNHTGAHAIRAAQKRDEQWSKTSELAQSIFGTRRESDSIRLDYIDQKHTPMCTYAPILPNQTEADAAFALVDKFRKSEEHKGCIISQILAVVVGKDNEFDEVKCEFPVHMLTVKQK